MLMKLRNLLFLKKEIAVIVEVHNAQESDAAKAEGPILTCFALMMNLI